MLPAALATVAACLCAAHASPSPTDNHAAYYPIKYTSYTNPKNLQSILASIDERLRTLDAVNLEQAKQSRRLDAIQHKIELLEATVSVRLEQVELATNRLEHRLHMLQTTMQNELDESSARVEHGQARVSAAALNLTLTLDSHRHLLDKVSGAYGETWRRALLLEGLTRDGLALVNVTRRELADGLRGLARRQRDYRLSAQGLDAAVAGAGDLFAKRLNEQTHKLDKKIQTVLTAQEHFLDSCHRIQKDEPRLDTHVADLLDKLLDTVINKTATTFHKLQLIYAEIRSHDTKVSRALSSRSSQPNEAILRKIESILRNATAPPPRDAELQKLTDKFIDLTNRADAALQQLEARLAESDAPADTDVTAAADKLIDKLKGINSEEEYDDYDEPSDDSEFFDDGGGGESENSGGTVSEAEGRDPSTARPPHRRHLHKHPYDRGPHRANP